MADSVYKQSSYIYQSRGIIARNVSDQAPPFTYLQLTNAEERQETAVSSRLGGTIISTTGLNNIYTLTKLISSPGNFTRYLGGYSGSQPGIYYQSSPTAFSLLTTNTSGNPFTTVVARTFEASLPWLFIADSQAMLKSSGPGVVEGWGITPPNQPLQAALWAPNAVNLATFNGSLTSFGFQSISNPLIASLAFTGSTTTNDIATLTGNSFAAGNLVIPDMVSSSGWGVNAVYCPNGTTGTISVWNMPATPTSPVSPLFWYGWQGTVLASATGSVYGSLSTEGIPSNSILDGTEIVLVYAVDQPQNVQEINLMLDVNNSNYTNSYFYKSITPNPFQEGVPYGEGAGSSPGTTTAEQTVASALYARAGGVASLYQVGSGSQNILPGDYPALQQLQPLNISSGSSAPGSATAFVSTRIKLTDFLPVGTAAALGPQGQQGQAWNNVTGWQIQLTTNAGGSATITVNGLFYRTGPNPDSYAGVAYDWRHTFYNQNTGTESNAGMIQLNSYQPGIPGVLLPTNQPCFIIGTFSPDTQVTHVRLYRRGGTLASGWTFVTQFINDPIRATWGYLDSFTDNSINGNELLALDNDAPITSTLQVPINTTTSNGLSPSTAPQTVNVAQATAVFVPNQIVDLDENQNLEQVTVVTGGTGTFTAVIQLNHASGSQVQVYSIPQQPVDICAYAFGQMWFAGDPNNPHYLYYSKVGMPESVPPQNYVEIGTPSDPIIAVIPFRGALFVATQQTWYQIYPGNPPTYNPTGSKHGLQARLGYTITESQVFYVAVDGIRVFSGADGPYASLIIEWLFENVPQSYTPVPIMDMTRIGDVQMAYWNNLVYIQYPTHGGGFDRLIYDNLYKRWRNDSVYCTSIFYEPDTNLLLYGTVTGLVVQDRTGDNDFGEPINWDIQTVYLDMGTPDNFKNFNQVTLDINTESQNVTPILHFDQDFYPPITLATVNTATRQKVQLNVNGGSGFTAYRVSLELRALVTSPVTVFQADILHVVLTKTRQSFDTYWIKMGTDESKLIKQGYFEYTAMASITVGLYAEGSESPYYTFTLPANSTVNPGGRNAVRVRFIAMKVRVFRVIATSTGDFELWPDSKIEAKPIQTGKGYGSVPLYTN